MLLVPVSSGAGLLLGVLILVVAGHGDQVIQVTADMPIPLCARECIQHAYAVDDIDDQNRIVIRAKSLEPDGKLVRPPARRTVRIDLDAGFVIQPCPHDHPVLSGSTRDYGVDRILLLTIKQQIDPHVSFVPVTLINFFTRKVLKTILGSLLQVAEDVQAGKRPLHHQAIANQPDLYRWIEERVDVMMGIKN